MGRPLAAAAVQPLAAPEGRDPISPRLRDSRFSRRRRDRRLEAGFRSRIPPEAVEPHSLTSRVAAGPARALVPEGLRLPARSDMAYRPPAPLADVAMVYRPDRSAATARLRAPARAPPAARA